MKLLKFIKRLLGYRKWYVFTANQTFEFIGKHPPPSIAGETGRLERRL